MAGLIADLFISLDGFAAADKAGPFFGYGGKELDEWIRTESTGPQVMVMGRVTYELMAAMSAKTTDEASTTMNKTPKVVVSNSLTEPLNWQNSRLLSGDLATGMAALKQESRVPLRTIGSISLLRSLTNLGLVDRLRLMVFPLTVGPDGHEPALAGYLRTGLDLAGTTVLDSRIVLLEYRPAPAG
ncbi:dihydrofolate reductase family protein [Actinoplanes sp. TFC3]|uniref:dihydrofolate reductase family protein n=1 Tax=Actinoplanes sp. TFC3 TaxID=1710355 RepID=UPI00083028AE|nr:dihydrofolate reductase family protein [Actinoplanes sp. TFC3]